MVSPVPGVGLAAADADVGAVEFAEHEAEDAVELRVCAGADDEGEVAVGERLPVEVLEGGVIEAGADGAGGFEELLLLLRGDIDDDGGVDGHLLELAAGGLADGGFAGLDEDDLVAGERDGDIAGGAGGDGLAVGAFEVDADELGRGAGALSADGDDDALAAGEDLEAGASASPPTSRSLWTRFQASSASNSGGWRVRGRGLSCRPSCRRAFCRQPWHRLVVWFSVCLRVWGGGARGLVVFLVIFFIRGGRADGLAFLGLFGGILEVFGEFVGRRPSRDLSRATKYTSSRPLVSRSRSER